ISEDAKVTLRYSFTNNRISDVDSSASLAVQSAEGTFNTSLVGYTLSYDTLDSPLHPTSGARASFAQDFAGLGGDVHYVRTTAKGEYFYSLYEGVVGRVGGSAGYITGWNGDDVRLLDRFYKGGESFRGFERAGIGPRDIGSSNEDAVGGE